MKFALAAVALLVLAGCGHAPVPAAAGAAAAALSAQAKANPFLGLTKLEAGEGGIVRKRAKRHLSTKTKMGGFLRLEEAGEVMLAFYNYDEISVPAKIAQIGAALDEAAAGADPAMAKTVQDFRAKLLAPNPFLGLKDVKFVQGPPPASTFWHLATRHVEATTADGGNLCLAEQRDVAYEFGIVRNGQNVIDNRPSNFAVEGFKQALPGIQDPEVAKFITEHFGS